MTTIVYRGYTLCVFDGHVEVYAGIHTDRNKNEWLDVTATETQAKELVDHYLIGQ